MSSIEGVLMDVRVLGPIAVTDGTDDVALGGPRQRRLLGALLLAEGRPATAERLAAAVWGDEPEVPDAGPRTVQSYVSRLRAALGEARVVGRDGGYVLVPDGLTVDADRFRTAVDGARSAPPERAVSLLDDALALWRGPAFGEFGGEPWARPAAARLEELRLVALELRAQARLDAGEHADVVPELEELVTAHPLRERFRAQLMLALYRTGRQAEALRSFQEHRRRLAEDTGLEPSRDLVELDRRISAADPTLAFVTAGRAKRGYVLADVIGEGAFGTVYRAVQPSVGREVAVKVIRPELADDPDYVRRFEGEARLVARLEHAHIVPLYDFWREPGGAYLVFRLLRGGSLEARRATEGRWSLDAVDRLVGEIGSALAVAHAAGVVHRDVKPANVLFDEAGDSYLADFGIALSGGADVDGDGLHSAGSPLYASPEQVRDGAATARSDQYALAVVAWELLAGAAPFDADRVTTLLRLKLERTVPPLGDRRADVPEAVDAVLRRAAAIHPDDRFPTMAEFLSAWREAVHRPVRAAVTTGSLEAPETSLTATLTRLGLEVTNPYQGLRAFDEGDAARFHGRTVEVDALDALVAAHRLVAVVGPSGSGKSSLVRAGLAPRLRDTGRIVVSVIPGARPIDELADALERVAVAPVGDVRGALLDPDRLADALDALLPPGSELVLALDQFEELWTLADNDVRDGLMSTLAAAASAPDGRMRVVVTVRADFYDRPLAHPAIGPLVRDATYALTPLGPAELERAITAPAAAVGVRLEPALVAELVADAAAQPASLPLLQYALTELFEQRDGATMTLAAYRTMGGLAGAISATAEALYDGFDTDGRVAVRRLFTRLVSPGEGSEDTRRRARRSELTGVAPAVVDAYGEARLLTFDVDPTDREPTVEVAHEALIRHWPRLRAWLDEDRDALRVHRHLADAAAAWEARGRDPGDLYRGARLEVAREWLTRHAIDASATETAFVNEADRRARSGRRLARAAVGALALLVVGALVAASLAVVQRRRADRNARAAGANAVLAAERADEAAAQAEQAQSASERADALRRESDVARLVAESKNVQPASTSLSLLLAKEAEALEPGSARTRGALQSALVAEPGVLAFLFGDRVATRSVAVSADGGTLIASRVDGKVDVWGLPRRERLRTIAVGGKSVRAALDESGTTMAVARTDGTFAVWDVRTGVPLIDPVATGAAAVSSTEPAQVVRVRGRGFLLSAVDRVVFLGDDRMVRTVFAATGIVGVGAAWDGTLAAVTTSSDKGGVVTTLDTSTWQPQLSFPTGLAGFSSRVVLSTRARRVVVSFGGSGGTARVFDLDTGAPAGTTVAFGNSPVPVFSPDGEHLWVSASSGELGSLDPLSGVLLDHRAIAYHDMPGSTELAVSDDGRELYVATFAGVVLISTDGRSSLGRPLSGLRGLAIPDDAGMSISLFGRDAMVSVIDAGGRTLAGPVGADTPVPLAATLPSVTKFSPDGRYLAVGGFGGRLRLLERQTLEVAGEIPTPATHAYESTFAASFGPLGTRYVAVGAWSPDGRRLVASTWDSLLVVDVEHRRIERECRGWNQWVFNVSIASDGRFATASDFAGTTRTVRLEDCSLEAAMPGSNHVRMPDGHTLALSQWDNGRIEFRDDRTGNEVRPPIAPRENPAVLGALTPDGRYLTVSSSASGFRMYDPISGEPVGDAFPSAEVSLPFALAGTDLMLTSGDQLIVWDLSPASWGRKACEVAGRNLTKAEWAKYLPADETYRPTCPQYSIEA